MAKGTDGNLNLEKLRFDQLGEVIDAFMERLPVGEVALEMAVWDTHRGRKGHAAFLAYDAGRLKRLNDECEREFKKIEAEWKEVLLAGQATAANPNLTGEPSKQGDSVA